jgi:nucleotide-binding universal stress UspA family protein
MGGGHPRRVAAGVEDASGTLVTVDLAVAAAVARTFALRFVAADAATAQTAARRAYRTTHRLAIDTRVVRGDLAGALVEESREAGLLVVGGVGGRAGAGGGARGGAARGGVSSLAELVAGRAYSPVLVAPADPRPGGAPAGDGPVVVGVDPARMEEETLAFAFEEAALRRVPLVAVHVWSGEPPGGLGAVLPYRYDLRAAWSAADRLLAEALAGWADRYPHVRVERQPRYDANVERAMLDAAEEAGVVVVGARRFPAFSPLLLGAVPRALIRRAACPVAVVRLGGGDRANIRRRSAPSGRSG